MKLKSWFAIGMAAAGLLGSSCGSDDPVDMTCTIQGTVTDSRTGEPLQGASVALAPTGKTYSTGSDGKFSFTGLDAGSYTLQASKANYQTNKKSVSGVAGQTIHADLQLTPDVATLVVSQQTLDFGLDATTLTLDIANTGNSVLTWQVSEDIAWLACTPTSGSTQAGERSAIIVTVDRGGLSQGSYTQTLALSSNGGSAVITVTMSVRGLSLTLSPAELDFGAVTSVLPLTLTNGNPQGGAVSYAVSTSAAWIAVSKSSGSVANSDIVSVTVSRTGLSVGDYTGHLYVDAAGERQQVVVRMNVPDRSAPTVVLYSVDDIGTDVATFRGAVTAIGSSGVIRHGFCWAKTENPDINALTKTNLGDCAAPKDIVTTATSLEENTVYYVRAYAENGEGIAYSEPKSFTTLGRAQLPTVTTGAVSDITAATATAAATLADLGGNGVVITQHGHVWSTRATPTTADAKTTLGATQQTGPYTSTLTGLAPATTYHVRAYATNERGTAYGDDVTFTTAYGDVNLTTLAATDIIHNAATCGGSISDKGGNSIAERGVCYGTAANPTTADGVAIATSSADRFTVRVTGLTERTAYHIRAYVTTGAGKTFYGNDLTFTTTHEITLAAAAATTVSGIGIHAATFRSSVTSDGDGNIADCGFVYAKTANPTTADVKLSCGATTGTFTTTATGLSENTTYHVRAYVTNEAGTAYGPDVSFATLEILPPSLSAITVRKVTHRSASLAATVTDLHNGTLADAGFVYSTNPAPTLSNHKLSCGATTTPAGQLTDLIPVTTYYVRAYATNEKGTAYSDEVIVTTLEKPQDSSVDINEFGNDNNWDE